MTSSHDRRVAWSEGDSQVVRDVGELDKLLDRLFADTARCSPIIAVVDGPDEQCVFLGIGGSTSFVSFCEMPHSTTVGNPTAEGEVDYFYYGYPSQISKRNLIPVETARRLVREFFQNGTITSWQSWEEI